MKELQERMDAREFTEWIAYNNLDPIGKWRDDLPAGIIASTLHNCHCGKDTPSAKPKDYMPQFGRTIKKTNPAAMGAVFRALATKVNERG